MPRLFGSRCAPDIASNRAVWNGGTMKLLLAIISLKSNRFPAAFDRGRSRNPALIGSMRLFLI
jgi:hypothetical protein